MKSSTRNKGYKPWRCRQWWIPYRKWGISFHGLSRGCSVTQSKRGCQPCYLFSWEAKSYMLPHQNCAPLLCFHLIFNAFPFPFTCNNPVPHCPHIIERKKNRWGGKYRKWAAITPLLSSFRQYTETPLSPWLQQKRVISKAATTVCLALCIVQRRSPDAAPQPWAKPSPTFTLGVHVQKKLLHYLEQQKLTVEIELPFPPSSFYQTLMRLKS